MNLPPLLQLLVAILGALGLTGMLGPWIVRRWKAGGNAELVEQMKATFATVETFNRYTEKWDHALGGFTARVDREMKSLDDRVTGAVSAIGMANTNAEEALGIAEKAADRMEKLEDRWTNEILPRLEKIADRQQELGEAIAEQTGVLKGMRGSRKDTP